MIRLTRADFKAPALLVALSLVPILGGVARLNSLSNGAAVAADDARFFAAPTPVVVHVVAATIYALLGAFQFSTGIRLRWRAWHRRAGVLLLGCALLTGGTGIWMTAAYAIPQSLQGPLLYGVRLVVGVAMLAAIIKGWASIVRRDLAEHEAWMIRAYALAQGAGTQAMIFLPLMLITSGPVLGLTRDVLLSAAWVVNIVAAEWIIRRRRRGYERAPSRTTALAAATNGS
jgi:Predicted membrane protein (DUF2306)